MAPPSLSACCTFLEFHPVTGKQVHDANLVASMIEYGVFRLLTFNVADFQRFTDVISLVPLDAAGDELSWR